MLRRAKQEKNMMRFLAKWWICSRPYSLSASLIPVLFGAVMAHHHSGKMSNFITLGLSLMAMILLQAGANILNDIHDLRNGLDRQATPVSGGLVRGLINERQAWLAVRLLFLSGSFLGLIIAWLSTPLVLAVGIPGVLIGWFYSHGRNSSLKFLSLGDAAVFLAFGILGALGSWIVQTGRFSWLPVIWSVPVSLLVIAILHANNWRDMESDRQGGVRTVANRLGDRGALLYFSLLIFAPFAILILLIILPPLLGQRPFPQSGLITLLCLPLAVRLQILAKKRKHPEGESGFITLDGSTAQLNLIFGMLCTLSLLLDILF